MNQIAIQETIQRLINQQVVPGVAWGRSQKIAYQNSIRALGNTGPFARQKISSASLYDLASLTKVIGTTNRMLQLIDTNQLTFSTTVGKSYLIIKDYLVRLGSFYCIRADCQLMLSIRKMSQKACKKSF